MDPRNVPAEQIASPTSPTFSAGSSGRTSFQSHGRQLSMVSESAVPPRPNRFSVQFPIPAELQSPIRTSTSPVREPASDSIEVVDNQTDPSDGNYLHLIAAQERRVLELKEELQKAEADLNRLKRDWARHEANKKRDDVRRLTRLQTLQTSVPASVPDDDTDGSSAWIQQEMERRKALLSSSRTSNRTVLPGQRHTRALSLLSPARDNIKPMAPLIQAPPPPPRKDSLQKGIPPRAEVATPQPSQPRLNRASTTGNVSSNPDVPAIAGLNPADAAALDHESLIRAGKKVATGFKDGLWNFWEDLRQATVGEESTQIPPPPPRRKSSTQTLRTARKQSSRSSLQGSSRSSSTIGKEHPTLSRKESSKALPDLANPSFWTDHGVNLQPPPQAATKKTPASRQTRPVEPAKRLSTASSEAWDTWDDSPQQSRSSSSVTSEATTLPSTVSGSPRTSLAINRESRDLSKKDAIPWPALKKSGIGSLRRTASNLLTEWEKSLTPSPGEEYQGETSDYMGASAEAAAYGATRRKND
ncbi:hypothetical protein PRZ48_007142 [Zasmidium cellare]|uniref:DUF4048 domain-containing protein n=1 Tax=Zasmidium cellare TaxID=395010 RepID=A0ABR0EII8_ZASCE|nr:hypothetical protein PRZ48_007142 [Zasmidium cellare]